MQPLKACNKPFNGDKENLGEAYAIYIASEDLTWNQPFCQRYDTNWLSGLFIGFLSMSCVIK